MTPVLPILRALVGSIFALAGVRALVRFAATVRDFGTWHIPVPLVSVPAIAATAVVCGVLLALGALTRPVALLLATISIGALFTAGRFGGGAYAVASPALFAACVVFAWKSARVGGPAPARPPGVQ